MFCPNCGAELNSSVNFCPFCGTRMDQATVSSSLFNKAVSAAEYSNRYNLVLISRGSCDAVTAGDLLEDVFGYTDAESGELVRIAPVVVAENLTKNEASTIAQMYTEYGLQVSITDDEDQFVDLTGNAVKSVFDMSGNLLAGAAAVIGVITSANRISSYRRFKKPSLLERIFHIGYKPAPPVYRRNFRPKIDPRVEDPRRTIRRPAASAPKPAPQAPAGRPEHGMSSAGRPEHGTPSAGRPEHGTPSAGRPGAGNQHDHSMPGHNGPRGGRR